MAMQKFHAMNSSRCFGATQDDVMTQVDRLQRLVRKEMSNYVQKNTRTNRVSALQNKMLSAIQPDGSKRMSSGVSDNAKHSAV